MERRGPRKHKQRVGHFKEANRRTKTVEEPATESQQPIPTRTCKKCGHEWIPRVPNPQRCPKCLSYDWDKEVKEEDNER